MPTPSNVFRSPEEQEWWEETQDMEVDVREYPSESDSDITPAPTMARRKPKPAVPQPQPKPCPPSSGTSVATTATKRRIAARHANLVKIKLPEGAAGNYIVDLHPGYKDQQLDLPQGVISAKRTVAKVWVVNRSDVDLYFDAGLPLVQLTPTDDHCLDKLDYDTLTSEAESSGERAEVAATETETADEYLAAEAADMSAASADDLWRWRETAKKYRHGSQLDEQQICRLGRLLEQNRDQFSFPGDHIGHLRGFQHVIDTGDAAPVARSAYRVSHTEKAAIEEEVKKMLRAGVIMPIQSAWASPVVLVSKRDGSIRFCVDYRGLNAVTKPDLYPLPRMDDCLDVLGGGHDTFTTMDACSAYWQVPMAQDSISRTTMITHFGTYAWKYMPFGLRNAPATMSRVVETIFSGYNRRICMVYLDDIVTFSRGFDQHLYRLHLLFRRMQQHGLRLKPEKCEFVKEAVAFLGHLVRADGILPDPERVRAILEIKTPTNVTDVRSFLGFTGFWRRFIQGYAKLARPLFDLTIKGREFTWGPAQQQAFGQLRDALLSPAVCAHFDPDAQLILRTDASKIGIGSTLNQVANGGTAKDEKLVACYSRSIRGSEKNYSANHLECLAINESIKHFRPYLWAKKFTVVTDHKPCCARLRSRDQKNPQGELALELLEYLFEPVYKQGTLPPGRRLLVAAPAHHRTDPYN